MSKIVHTEFVSDDARATADFVSEMFGWQVKKMNTPGMEYYLWNYPGEMMGGGIGSTTDRQGQKYPHIDIYVDVKNIAETVDKALSMGATQLMGETQIPDGMGYFAVLSIPGGCVLGIWAEKPSMKPETQAAMTQNS